MSQLLLLLLIHATTGVDPEYRLYRTGTHGGGESSAVTLEGQISLRGAIGQAGVESMRGQGLALNGGIWPGGQNDAVFDDGFE
ncbi:MAG: hypothetical protein QNJ40_14950 [Xanthomonadales bacterium]|nr:hypothetical protein [Xanthomonadales bacterium]